MFDDDSQANQKDNQTDNQAGPAPALGGNGSGFGSAAPSDDSNQDDSAADQDAPEQNGPAQASLSDPLASSPVSSDSSPSLGSSSNSSSGSSSDSGGKLDKIKSDALAQLSPLVHKLDQSPEEKYKTLMMMVQASDNQDLLPEAYEAAQKITDEKLKAEALLNIVNEVNYFTQKGSAA